MFMRLYSGQFPVPHANDSPMADDSDQEDEVQGFEFGTILFQCRCLLNHGPTPIKVTLQILFTSDDDDKEINEWEEELPVASAASEPIDGTSRNYL